jgi:RHS repeat-associated protein
LSNHLAFLFSQGQDTQAQGVDRLALALVQRAVLQGIQQRQQRACVPVPVAPFGRFDPRLHLAHGPVVIGRHRGVVQPPVPQRRLDVLVAHQRLERRERRARVDDQRGKRVPQLVRRHAHATARAVGVQAGAAVGLAQRTVVKDEHVLACRRPAHVQPLPQRLLRDVVEKHRAVLEPLRVPHLDSTVGQVEISRHQAAHLDGPQPAVEHHVHPGAVHHAHPAHPGVVGGDVTLDLVQEQAQLVDGHRPGEGVALVDGLHAQHPLANTQATSHAFADLAGSHFAFRVTVTDRVGNAGSVEAASRLVEVTKYYYHGGQRVAMRRNGVLTYLHGDHLGSTSLVTNDAGGFVARVLYYPYGETRYEEGTLTTDYQYTGQRKEGFGLYDYQARFYDPLLGRFVSADTIVPNTDAPQLWNRYAYAGNNPIAYNDPTGHILTQPMIDGICTPGSSCSSGGTTRRDESVWQKQEAADVAPSPWWQQGADFVAGAFMQYGDDMSMDILSGMANDLNVPYYENGYGSDAYQNGRFAGQIGSTITGVYLTVDGVWKVVEGAALVGAGGGSEILSGGSSSVVSIPTIGTGVGVIVVGGAEAGYGVGILGNNFSNPVSYAKGRCSGGRFTTNSNLARRKFDLSKHQFGDAIHDIKYGVEGNPDMLFDLETGDVIDQRSGEIVGNLLDYR